MFTKYKEGRFELYYEAFWYDTLDYNIYGGGDNIDVTGRYVYNKELNGRTFDTLNVITFSDTNKIYVDRFYGLQGYDINGEEFRREEEQEDISFFPF